MSGQKKLNRAIRTKKVVAIPSKEIKRVVTDKNGHIVVDKDNNAQMETVQLYRIKPMR